MILSLFLSSQPHFSHALIHLDRTHYPFCEETPLITPFSSGQVTDRYPCEDLDHHQTGETVGSGNVNLNGGFRINFKAADGTLRTKVFKGLDKVQVLRGAAKNEAEEEKEQVVTGVEKGDVKKEEQGDQ